MIKAHVTSVSVHGALEADSRTAGDTGTTVAVTTSTAAPIDTVIRVATAKAPTRPTHLLYPIVISSPAAPPVDAWDIAHSECSAKYSRWKTQTNHKFTFPSVSGQVQTVRTQHIRTQRRQDRAMSGAHDGSVVSATLKPSTPSNGYSQRRGGRSARTAASGRPDWQTNCSTNARTLAAILASATRCRRSASRCAPGCTPASARSAAMTAASACTSARA